MRVQPLAHTLPLHNPRRVCHIVWSIHTWSVVLCFRCPTTSLLLAMVARPPAWSLSSAYNRRRFIVRFMYVILLGIDTVLLDSLYTVYVVQHFLFCRSSLTL